MVSESMTADSIRGIKTIGELDGGQAQPCRVLVVEDDLDDQILAKKRLSTSPMVESIVFFSDGTELFNYLYDQGFHDGNTGSTTPMVIVLDLNMPLMGGFEVLQELKSDSMFARIPVLVLTGTQSKADIEKARQLKADAVFEKPLNLSKLETYFKQGWSATGKNRLN